MVRVSGLQTEAGTIVVLAPDWRRPLDWLPALAAYVVAAPLDGDTCLALDARGGELPVDAIAKLVERACEYVSEGRDFPEVLLVVDDVELGDRSGDRRRRPGRAPRLSVPPLAGDPETTVVHARWVKALVDELQAEVDRALLAAARPVRLEGEPLVTVRIPTFGSVDLLLERAIPSVLAGSYRNVELLVCSDGPQPHARAAVEGARRTRAIRYLEVDGAAALPVAGELVLAGGGHLGRQPAGRGGARGRDRAARPRRRLHARPHPGAARRAAAGADFAFGSR